MGDKTTKEGITGARRRRDNPALSRPIADAEWKHQRHRVGLCMHATYDPCALSPLSYGICGRAGPGST